MLRQPFVGADERRRIGQPDAEAEHEPAYMVTADVVMACIVMACIAMAYVVMDYLAMASMGMVYAVMACIVWPI